MRTHTHAARVLTNALARVLVRAGGGVQLTLFVLARDVARFRTAYDAEVLGWLAANGFTNALNKPIATVQDGCTY